MFITYAKCSQCGVEEATKPPDLPGVAIRKRSGWYCVTQHNSCGEVKGQGIILLCSHQCLIKWTNAEFSNVEERLSHCRKRDAEDEQRMANYQLASVK